MIGIVVPAHDEGQTIARTVRSLAAAAGHASLMGETVDIVVVLDSCTDDTAEQVRAVAEEVGGAAIGVTALAVEVRNVGIGRATGAAQLLARGARWLAFTDADTVVDPAWLAAQLALAAQGADAVCGTIGVIDWDIHGTDAAYLRADFDGTYSDIDGHAHIHGANLGVSAEAYRRAGGFEPLASEEDVALVAALRRVGATVVFSAAPKVWTSARIDSRARGGFGDAIRIALARNGAQG